MVQKEKAAILDENGVISGWAPAIGADLAQYVLQGKILDPAEAGDGQAGVGIGFSVVGSDLGRRGRGIKRGWFRRSCVQGGRQGEEQAEEEGEGQPVETEWWWESALAATDLRADDEPGEAEGDYDE
jgi:hypothetical protein